MKTLLASLSPMKAEIATLCPFSQHYYLKSRPLLSSGSGFTEKPCTAKYTAEKMIHRLVDPFERCKEAGDDQLGCSNSTEKSRHGWGKSALWAVLSRDPSCGILTVFEYCDFCAGCEGPFERVIGKLELLVTVATWLFGGPTSKWSILKACLRERFSRTQYVAAMAHTHRRHCVSAGKDMLIESEGAAQRQMRDAVTTDGKALVVQMRHHEKD